MSVDKSVQIFETEETQESSAANNASAKVLQEIGDQIATNAMKDLKVDKSFPSAGDLLRGLGGTDPSSGHDSGTTYSAHNKGPLESLNDAQKSGAAMGSKDEGKYLGPLEKLNNGSGSRSESEKVQQAIKDLAENLSQQGHERHQEANLNERPHGVAGSQIEKGAREIRESNSNRLDNLEKLWKDSGRSQAPRPADR